MRLKEEKKKFGAPQNGFEEVVTCRNGPVWSVANGIAAADQEMLQ